MSMTATTSGPSGRLARGTTLYQHILLSQQEFPDATGEFAGLMAQISLAAKLISRQLAQAGLVEDVLGFTGETNVQGERVRHLDQYANETFIRVFKDTGLVCLLVSEELEEPLPLSNRCPLGSYALIIDPVDGSSNIDVNVSVASIFSIQRRNPAADDDGMKGLLQRGTAQVAAGYVLYGPNTLLVYTSGQGVHGFTLDAELGEFVLSHPDMRIPERGEYYSVNEAYSANWPPSVREYIDHLKSAGSRGEKPYSARYIGSLAADFHRTLITGGIFLYPGTVDKPKGKLRLLYEAAPLALVAEQAGGRASTGSERILDIAPTSIHQRVPLILGSPFEVDLAVAYARGGGTVPS
jgi:fructose-1,6-bisphosphatase I